MQAETRCVVDRDSGRTQGDDRLDAYICIHFARGCCGRGFECGYLHRLPIPDHDERRLGRLQDCFGRERHRTDREDMNGTGSFLRDCRTLFVGGLALKPDVDMQKTLIERRRQPSRIVAPVHPTYAATADVAWSFRFD